MYQDDYPPSGTRCEPPPRCPRHRHRPCHCHRPRPFPRRDLSCRARTHVNRLSPWQAWIAHIWASICLLCSADITEAVLSSEEASALNRRVKFGSFVCERDGRKMDSFAVLLLTTLAVSRELPSMCPRMPLWPRESISASAGAGGCGYAALISCTARLVRRSIDNQRRHSPELLPCPPPQPPLG